MRRFARGQARSNGLGVNVQIGSNENRQFIQPGFPTVEVILNRNAHSITAGPDAKQKTFISLMISHSIPRHSDREIKHI